MTDRRADGRAASAPAAQSGAGDVALFGAIPLTFAESPAAAEAGTIHIARAPAVTTGGAHLDTDGDDTTLPAIGDGQGGLAGHLASDTDGLVLHAPALAAPTGGSPTPSGDAAAPSAQAPAAHPVGSHIATFVSSVTPHAMADVMAGHASTASISAAQDHAPSNALAMAESGVDDAVATIRATAASLHDAISALADRLVGDDPPSAEGVASAVDADLQDVRQQVDAVLDHVGDIGAAAADQAEAAIADATDTVATATQAVTADVSTAIDQVSGLVDHAGAAVAGLTDHATGAVAEATGLAGAAAAALVPDDHLDGLAGADPAAGVATLVDMVGAADAFDLHDTAAAIDLSPALGALGSADFLADVAPSEALLGVHDQHEGILSSVTDHLHDGLFGHG